MVAHYLLYTYIAVDTPIASPGSPACAYVVDTFTGFGRTPMHSQTLAQCTTLASVRVGRLVATMVDWTKGVLHRQKENRFAAQCLVARSHQPDFQTLTRI